MNEIAMFYSAVIQDRGSRSTTSAGRSVLRKRSALAALLILKATRKITSNRQLPIALP
jgi:hypothetical protein